MSDPSSIRRYWNLKRLDALDLLDFGLASGYRTQQLSAQWPDLPVNFPARSKLIAQGYNTVRDIEDAEERELQLAGLSRSEAKAVIKAMEIWKMLPLQQHTYQRQDGTSATDWIVNFLTAGTEDTTAKTATFTSDTIELGSYSTYRAELNITAASGTTPTLDVVIQTSKDGVTNWQQAGYFSQQTAVSSHSNVFPNCDRFVRVVCTIGGTTPSFTFTMKGYAV